THNGLARWDGVRFVSFDPVNTPALKHARVFALLLDSQGTLWINTYDGSVTSWRNGVFTHEWQGGQIVSVISQTNQTYFVLQRGDLLCRSSGPDAASDWQSIPLTGLTTGYSFREDRFGALWYFTRDGVLARVVGTNSETLPRNIGLKGERVTSLAADSDRNIWVGTEREIARWNGNRFEDQSPTNGPPIQNALFLFCTRSNGCWVLSDGNAGPVLNRDWKFQVGSSDGLFGTNLTYLGAYEDQAGGVWFRHFGQGLFHAKPDGSTQRFTSTNGLPGDRVSSWFQDREGNVWVGVERGGLVRLRSKRFHVVGAAEGLANPAVSSICEDRQGDLWIATFGGGLNRWRNGTLQRFELPEGIFRASFFSIFPDPDGRLWLSAGREDLSFLDKETISSPREPVHGIKCLLRDQVGNVWMGRHGGLTRWANGVVTNFGPPNGPERRDIRALAEDEQGNVWIGGGEGVLYKTAGEHFAAYRVNDGLMGQAIWSILPDKNGTLWIGTFRGGLLRFQNGKFTRYTTQQGLPSDIICQILNDGRGNLWIGSHRGIFSLALNAIQEFDEGRLASLPCVAYGLYDGLPTLECTGNYQPSCWRTRDGTLWFATVKGAVAMRPGEVSVNRQPPPIVIEEMLVDGKSSPPVEDPSGKNPRQVPPGKHQVEFRYTALSFVAPDKVRFKYRLAGLDVDWVDAGTKRSAHLGPLRPGRYRFEVIACNSDGIWNEHGASLRFEVLPEFWETWWFKGAVAFAVIGLVVGTVRFAATRSLKRKIERLHQQRAVERDRERIAKDIHDDLGAGLTQIMLQSALARRDGKEKAEAHFNQISDTARDLVRAMDEIVWAVNPENDTLDGLATYIGKFVYEYVTLAGLRCRLKLPATLPSLPVSADVRHNLFLAIRETLNNILKHARATEVFVQLTVEGAAFTFLIRDNGRGFPEGPGSESDLNQSRISSGHGVRNLKTRLEKIGGRCVIRSEANEGTEVELTVVIQNKAAADRS
ncbi:MAG: ATP-binding protein, partial [Akkermansiaceae bacterium]|nr:ATP-binding protein [Verrucomicrobiales bacterium]